ncbi:MAG TPA: TetR family transcriptional regulator [Acidimicrobiales bacterium]|nr:TetR family transcriptional regulator [Acidimicrobiales bacterium]
MSLSSPPGPAFGDLTARARIRDAALRLFGERGLDGASIRDVATAAGVSGGLVRHHFGSKEDLRAACDAHALDQLMRFKEQALLEGGLDSPSFMSSAHPTILALLRYLARSIADGSPAADAMFDRMVALGEDWLALHHAGTVRDRHGLAVLLVAMELGALMLGDQLSRALGGDVLAPDGHLQMMRARIDLYSTPLLSPELAAQAHVALDRLQGTRTGRRAR